MPAWEIAHPLVGSMFRPMVPAQPAQPVVAIWQCCTRSPHPWVPLGATWVDYVPDINDIIESRAREGNWVFELYFETNDTVYVFDLVLMVQRNKTTGRERALRRCVTPLPARL